MELVLLPKQQQQQIRRGRSSSNLVLFEMESTTSSPQPHQLFSSSNPTANNNSGQVNQHNISGQVNQHNNSSSGDSSTTSTTAARRRMREFETLSLDMSKYPRGGGDLLHTFLSSSDPTTDHHFLRRHNHNHNQQGFAGGISISERLLEEEQELELNLGLSLGGRFGVDKTRKGLVRSSSIAGTMPLIRDEDTMGGAVTTAPPQADCITSLARTTSLPTETEDEWRRRKEIQTLRRMEAKRRRSEKQKVLKDGTVNVGEDHRGAAVGVVSPAAATATAAAGDSGISLNFRGRLEREQQHMLGLPNNFNNPNHLPSTTSSTTSSMVDLGLAGQWPAAAGGKEIDPAGGGGIKAQRGFFSSLHGLLARQQQQQPQQGSDPASGVESQGGGCSSAAAAATSNPESRTHQGGSHAKIPARTQSLPLEQGSSQETSPGSASRSSQRQQPPENNNKHKRKESGGVEDMPCVFTIGDGPNGRKVEGILYKYGKGEEVRIMCVCHGSFFSPAEFVKHAGGRDVDHPLRHIVVNPS